MTLLDLAFAKGFPVQRNGCCWPKAGLTGISMGMSFTLIPMDYRDKHTVVAGLYVLIDDTDKD